MQSVTDAGRLGLKLKTPLDEEKRSRSGQTPTMSSEKKKLQVRATVKGGETESASTTAGAKETRARTAEANRLALGAGPSAGPVR